MPCLNMNSLNANSLTTSSLNTRPYKSLALSLVLAMALPTAAAALNMNSSPSPNSFDVSPSITKVTETFDFKVSVSNAKVKLRQLVKGYWVDSIPVTFKGSSVPSGSVEINGLKNLAPQTTYLLTETGIIVYSTKNKILTTDATINLKFTTGKAPTQPLSISETCTPVSGTAPLAVNCTQTATGGTAPYTYSVTFGDGATATTATASHTYASAGTFSASATVTDSLHKTATASQAVTVAAVAAASGCSAIPDLGVAANLNCMQIFPADSPWNTPVDKAPVDPNSATWIQNSVPTAGLHPDFGGGGVYGIPYVVVDNSTPLAPIEFTAYGSESDPGPYPFPLTAPIEGCYPAYTPAACTDAVQSGDRHVLVINRDTHKLYETYHAHLNSAGNGWTSDSGAVFDLASNNLRPNGWTSADAAGLPIFPGLVRYDEVKAGVIKHALRLTLQNTQLAYLNPATHGAGLWGTGVAPMGTRFRLKSSVDISNFPPQSKVILQALKTYGLILADNGSPWFFSGTQDTHWDDNDLNTMKTIPGNSFEVVSAQPVLANGQPDKVPNGIIINHNTGSTVCPDLYVDTPNVKGNWIGKYGAKGYMIANGASSLPSYAQVTVTSATARDWASPTTDARALQTPDGTKRVASAWHGTDNGTFTINVANKDTQPHTISVYFLDWLNGTTQNVRVMDGVDPTHSQLLTCFGNGEWMTYTLQPGTKTLITPSVYNHSGYEALASGIFFND